MTTTADNVGQRPDAKAYGDSIADLYDALLGTQATPAGEIVEFLGARSSPGSRILELGSGTGRIALPLAGAGHQVYALEVSEAMSSVLRGKPGAEAITTVTADMTSFDLGIEFDLIFSAFNSFLFLTTPGDQVQCLRSATAHLRAGGKLALETMVPDFHSNPSLARFGLTAGKSTVMLDQASIDPIAQRIDAIHVIFGEGGFRTVPVHMRFVYLSELDLMAEMAGLRVLERGDGWGLGPVSLSTKTVVTVYEKPT